MVVSYSTNAGNYWNRCVLSDTSRGFAYSLSVAPSQPNIIYAGGHVHTNGAVYVSTDFGQTWNPTTTAPDDTVYCLVVHPENKDVLYAATPIGIYKTTDGGITWVNKGGGTNLKAIRLFPHHPDTIVIGGDHGVLISFNGGDEWSYFNTGLDYIKVNCLEFSADNQISLFAGTIGGATYIYTFETGIEDGWQKDAVSHPIKIFPTLTRNRITLLLNKSLEPQLRIKLWDISGRMVWQNVLQSVKGKLDLTLPDLQTGVYHLELIGNSKRTQTKILIMW
jgi:hypothetical protein